MWHGMRLSPVVFVAIVASACEGSSPLPVPTAPTAPASAPASHVPFTLSGTVFELTPAGRVAVEDVEIYCDACGSPVGHTFTHTDVSGSYAFSWAYPGTFPLLLRKDGYRDPSGQLPGTVKGWLTRQVTVAGDTRFDIEIVRESPAQ